MDTRIAEKLKEIETARNEKYKQEILKNEELSRKHKAYVESKMPDARKWVADRLLDLVAQAMAEPVTRDGFNRPIRKELDLDYCDKEDNGNRNIPGEAKFAAAKEIDGLIVKQRWVPECNEVDFSYPAHYCYTVTWTQYGVDNND